MESTAISGDGTFWIRRRVSGEDVGHPEWGPGCFWRRSSWT